MNTSKKPGLLGFYNYTVVLTYTGLLVAFAGICLALNGCIFGAVVCLMVAGLCDTFDGAIAATRERTRPEKRFGIQIDSLCDLVCFGVLPALLVGAVNDRSLISDIICGLYVLCALIRLAYFNVLEEERQEQTEQRRKSYLGLPVTTIALLIPIAFLADGVKWSGLVLLAVVGIAFLLPFQIPKPSRMGQLALVVLGVLEFGLLLLGAG